MDNTSTLESKLQAVYGSGSSQQKVRYTSALNAFGARFGPGPVQIYRAPGRVNLIGEHTDYNHGYVMPVALDRDVLLLARLRSDNLIQLHNVEEQFPPRWINLGPEIPIDVPGDWGNYAQGVAQNLAQGWTATADGRPLRGFDGMVAGSPPDGVPRGAGLSSSSALTVAIAVALADLNEWRPPLSELVRLCSDAEWYVGTRGGIMDHVIAFMGKTDHALFLDCRPGSTGEYTTMNLPLPRDYTLLVVNSGVKHQNVSGDFNRRVASCRAGVALLRTHYPGITHLRDVEAIPWETISLHLPQQISVAALTAKGIELEDIPGIGPETLLNVQARCRHVWTENRRVQQAGRALQQGDTATLGQLLLQAHASARDDYEISCPEVEALVTLLNRRPGVLGVRLTGAGWGGCVVALVEKNSADDISHQIAVDYLARTGLRADCFICLPGPGAGPVAQLELDG